MAEIVMVYKHAGTKLQKKNKLNKILEWYTLLDTDILLINASFQIYLAIIYASKKYSETYFDNRLNTIWY